MLRSRRLLSFACLLVLTGAPLSAQPLLDLQPGEKVVFVGNTLAEQLNEFHDFELKLYQRFPAHDLTVRNLGWSGDTIGMRLRSLDFPDHGHTLFDHQPDVILAFIGFNESFAGPEGLPEFERELSAFLEELKQWKYPSTNYRRGSTAPNLQDKSGEVTKASRIVLISPIANEDLPEQKIPAGSRNNSRLKLYTESMRKVAQQEGVPFVDLLNPSLRDWNSDTRMTFNGCHLNADGSQWLAAELDRQLFGTASAEGTVEKTQAAALKAAIAEKNRQFDYDHRAVNGYYIYGGRKEPFGVVNFPAEFAKLRKMTAVRDARIWKAARGESLPETIDDSGTGEFVPIETNFKHEVTITSPEESAKQFTLADGFEVSLWASEVEFPNLANPVQFTFDAQGRMWLVTMPSYPMYLPGQDVDDKVLILADTDGDGKADQESVFAGGLHVPTGIELAHGGAYVAQQPNLMFLKDTDGDGTADLREIRLRGFDSADSHHSLSAFEIGPGGELYFLEGTFHHSQVETWRGLRRVANAAVYRYEPRTEKLDIFVSYNFANPWGMCFDRWGQNFIADASGGANYFAAPFSGEVDHPRQHPGLKQFLTKQWRPTCGCEVVSSRHFPEEMQGDYLLNNCIGFQGVLQYRMREDGSGYHADPVSPLLRSSDPNFRPVDLQFGPDGALYVLDWFNPLVGHMQHSLRDPNRDKQHGRIWRITCKDRPLLTPPAIANEPIESLLQLLDSPEDRTRFRIRRELGERPTESVMAGVDNWISGLDADGPPSEPLLLEAVWIKQHHNVVDKPLLGRLLSAEDGRVRAAAVRVLCYWRDEIPETLSWLRTAVNDSHPRVRLEAVRALSFFDSQEAMDIAVESLVHEQDEYLEYTLNETLSTLSIRLGGAQQ